MTEGDEDRDAIQTSSGPASGDMNEARVGQTIEDVAVGKPRVEVQPAPLERSLDAGPIEDQIERSSADSPNPSALNLQAGLEGAAVLDAFASLGSSLVDRFEKLQSFLERESRAEAARERVVDRLHAELEEYKQDLLLKILRPIFIDLIQLHDDLGKMAEAGEREDSAASSVRLPETLRNFQQGVEDILYRQGVEPYQVEGDVFDARRQRTVSSSPTTDPAQSRTIYQRLRKGFQADDKVIRPELVSVYIHKQ